MTQDTLSLVKTSTDIYLATYDRREKRWYKYADGNYLKPEVESFFPLYSADWLTSTPPFAATIIVQEISGRYALAHRKSDGLRYFKGGGIIRKDILRFTRIDCLKPGVLKNVEVCSL